MLFTFNIFLTFCFWMVNCIITYYLLILCRSFLITNWSKPHARHCLFLFLNLTGHTKPNPNPLTGTAKHQHLYLLLNIKSPAISSCNCWEYWLDGMLFPFLGFERPNPLTATARHQHLYLLLNMKCPAISFVITVENIDWMECSSLLFRLWTSWEFILICELLLNDTCLISYSF